MATFYTTISMQVVVVWQMTHNSYLCIGMIVWNVAIYFVVLVGALVSQ